jgi:hypothetical protein
MYLSDAEREFVLASICLHVESHCVGNLIGAEWTASIFRFCALAKNKINILELRKQFMHRLKYIEINLG